MTRLRMNRALVLEAAVATADGAGGDTVVWQALGTVWADVRARSGRAKSGVGGAVSALSYKVTLRAAPLGSSQRPVAGQRFREGPRTYRIDAVTEADALARQLICYVTEERAL